MSKNKPKALVMAQRILSALVKHNIVDTTKKKDQEALQRIAELLHEAGFQGKETSHRSVTILLSDIRGYSKIAETYPTDKVVDMLNRYFAHMGNIIVKHNGTIDKLMGDSIMVAFGLPGEKGDDVQSALACAIEMQQSMNAFNKENESFAMPPLYMGIGINTGVVVAGDLGSEHYSEYTVIGDAVNLTSRIEAHCLRGQILISENTYERAKDYVKVGGANRIEVKGSSKPVSLYELRQTARPTRLVVPSREGRKSKRVPVRLPIRFQCLSGKMVLPESMTGTVLDIGYYGLLIESDTKLAKLSEIKVSLALELFDNKTTDIYARILNSEESAGKYRSSMEFTSIDIDGQRTIKQTVDQYTVSR